MTGREEARARFYELLKKTIRSSDSCVLCSFIFRTIRIKKKVKNCCFALGAAIDKEESRSVRLHSPPPPTQEEEHWEEGDVNDPEMEEKSNGICEMVTYDPVEIADIAEEKRKIEFRISQTKSEREKQREMDSISKECVNGRESVLVHSASFYGLLGSSEIPTSPPSPRRNVAKTGGEEEVKQEIGRVGWGEEGEEEEEGKEMEDNPEFSNLGLMVRSDTRQCLIVPADWCVTPR